MVDYIELIIKEYLQIARETVEIGNPDKIFTKQQRDLMIEIGLKNKLKEMRMQYEERKKIIQEREEAILDLLKKGKEI